MSKKKTTLLTFFFLNPFRWKGSRCPVIKSKMSNMTTNELGGMELNALDILRIRRMYGCGKFHY